MPEPKICSLRKTRPVGPTIVCDDLPCFPECYRLTYEEKYGVKYSVVHDLLGEKRLLRDENRMRS